MLSVIVNLYFRQAGNRKRNDPHSFEGNASEIILPERRVNDVLLNTCTIQAGCAKTPTDYGPSFHSVTASNPGKQCELRNFCLVFPRLENSRDVFARIVKAV